MSALPPFKLVAGETSYLLFPVCSGLYSSPQSYNITNNSVVSEVIKGTVNDPAPVPTPNPAHGSFHWKFERLLAAGLVPLTVAPFAAGSLNPVADALLCGSLLVHSHLGFQSIIIDYIPTKRLPTARKIAWWGLNAATILAGVGIYEFETNDVGLTEAIKRVWKA